MVSKAVVYLFMGCMLVFGSANTILTKLMDLEGFSHPYLQCTGLFIGEALCLVFYLIRTLLQTTPTVDPVVRLVPSSCLARTVHKLGKYSFVISASFNICASTLALVGLLLSAPSVYQMIRGTVIIVVAAYTKFLLKRKLFKHQYLGVALVFIGVTAVGFSGVFGAQSSAPDPVLGIVILVIAQLFQAGMFVSQEYLLDAMTIDPLLAVGIEGSTGVLLLTVVILPVLYAIPCTAKHVCSGGRVEDSPAALEQLFSSEVLVATFVGVIFSLCIFNFAGMTTTKMTTSLARSIIDTCRTLFVWVFSLAIGWEVVSPFTALQFFGFTLLVLGTFIYNQILVFDRFGIKASVLAYNEYMRHIKQETPDNPMHPLHEGLEKPLQDTR
jgi:hypothetical protein